jgi:hypothetical protein
VDTQWVQNDGAGQAVIAVNEDGSVARLNLQK